ncbi:MAG: helicase-exonuclease AddAB subunit AddB [Blautia sp.]|nr:helicase-exonuclease AddAB subunit AddB [Blautia sp.]MCM1200800.1 helicase-exonuclease AddAB subunit AddB [Bacteroides fragilis]
MALQFYFGGSGAGKSRKLHEDIIAASRQAPKRNFLLIVPDQFTMQTQMDLVLEHPNRGIMNIDVLSFGRLTHRILEEVGYEDMPVLDDTGKSLILRKIAEQEQQKLSVIGKHLHKIGYIHEVKSAISEFMQYGIGTKELSQLAEYARKRGALYYKLKDLQVLYESFLSYIQEKFITTEETLDRLREALPKSEIIRDCVIAFDGFTGFTPIQYRVIQELMRLTSKVIVTITIDTAENPYQPDGEQKLFHLSKKTVADLRRLGEEAGVPMLPAVLCNGAADEALPAPEPAGYGQTAGRLPRFADNPELAHLERYLFRYPVKPYEAETERIHLMEASTPKEEVRQTCIEIYRLLGKDAGLHYRDIAVVTGSMETYGNDIEEEFARFGIPVYMDQTRGILFNPFTEYIRSALQIVLQDFSREAVFHYLRTGLCGFEREDIDRLENYIRRFGIRGRNRWESLFIYKEEEGEAGVARLAFYNEMREKLMEQLAPLLRPCRTADELVRALYAFLVKNELQQKLARFEAGFKKEGDLARAKEYGQIYGLVIDLLDQIEGLLKEEPMAFQEFAEILDSGFAEITVGTIPQNVDRIVVGDIERTRLKQVKALFFLGINDGSIPKGTGGGGIISDIDREFLQESGWELAPTPRQQMYIQRLYLYLNMTKPSERLYLSYAKVGSDGKSMRPAYLIDTMQKLFPSLVIQSPELLPMEEQLSHGADGILFFTDLLREYAAGRLEDEEERKLFTFFQSYDQNPGWRARIMRLVDTAFYYYRESPLSRQVTKALYGTVLHNSVSRLEKYAACAYAHFLQYGLSLKERGEYGFEDVDMGNVFHGVLELFADKLEERHYTWFDFPQEEGEKMLDEAIEAYAVGYGGTVLYSSARNQYLLKRIRRILSRTIRTLQIQLKKGSFLPEHFEMSFSMLEDLDAVNIALSGQEKMKLRGRIDRIDACEEEDTVYVKVIDYKSGSRKFDLAALYYGLQLQLVVYMNAAVEIEQKKHPGKKIVPAAMLYYHIADPVIEDGQALTPEQLNRKILQELKTTGLVNSDDKAVRLLDGEFTGKSDILPIERKKDGSFSAYSSVISDEDMTVISNYVNHKIKELGTGILQGNISVNPCEQNGNSSCTYCAYRSICGYDTEIAGYEMRQLENLPPEEAVRRMEKTG